MLVPAPWRKNEKVPFRPFKLLTVNDGITGTFQHMIDGRVHMTVSMCMHAGRQLLHRCTDARICGTSSQRIDIIHRITVKWICLLQLG